MMSLSEVIQMLDLSPGDIENAEDLEIELEYIANKSPKRYNDGASNRHEAPPG